MVSGGSPQVDTLTGPSKANAAQPAATAEAAAAEGVAEDEEAEEGELEPGERAAGWDSGPEEEAGRYTGEPEGPQGSNHTAQTICRLPCRERGPVPFTSCMVQLTAGLHHLLPVPPFSMSVLLYMHL